MSSVARALTPRDRAAAARTLVLATAIGLAVNVVWELYGFATGLPTSDPSSAGVTVAVSAALVLLAVALARAPERVPPLMYALLPPIGAALQVAICLSSGDATAAGQIGFLYPVVYAAAHFRPPFAWGVAALALSGDAVVVLRLLPTRVAMGDLIVMGAAVTMLTAVLVTAGSHGAHLLGRLEELARADPLTGLATRRELEAAAGRLMGTSSDGASGRPADRRATDRRGTDRRGTDRRATDPRATDRRATERPGGAALVLIDVDRFKDLNDTRGHPVGDAALVHVARVLRSAVGASDTVARLGGDELAVLLPGSFDDDAVDRARAVHDAVRRSPLRLADLEVPMTVSVGVAHGRAGEATLAELYTAADAALYRAKVGGRDGVVVASV